MATEGERFRRARGDTVKLTKSSSIDPQDTGLEPVGKPPCWGSETAVSLNLTIPPGGRLSSRLIKRTLRGQRLSHRKQPHDGLLRAREPHLKPVGFDRHTLRQPRETRLERLRLESQSVSRKDSRLNKLVMYADL